MIWGVDLAWLLGYGGVFGIAVAYWAVVNVNRSPAGRRHIHRPAGRARVRPAVLGGGAGRVLDGALLAGMGLIVGIALGVRERGA